jgi:hypothetical protein
MQWQDWVFSVGGFLIFASLVPTIRGADKPALTTSAFTCVLIFIFTFTMATLGLYLAAVANSSCAIAWGILAYQKYTQVRQERHENAFVQIEHEIEVTLGEDDLDVSPALKARTADAEG